MDYIVCTVMEMMMGLLCTDDGGTFRVGGRPRNLPVFERSSDDVKANVVLYRTVYIRWRGKE